MKIKPLIFLGILAIPMVCLASDLSQQIKAPQGFTINLPGDWIAIPRNVLDEAIEAIAKSSPQTERQVYDYGFQLANFNNWFTYPYILVQVKRTGKIPESEFKFIQQVRRSFNNAIRNQHRHFPDYIANLRIGEPIYDPKLHILWTEIDMSIGKEKVKGLIALLLTESGAVAIDCYAKAQDFVKYQPLFQTIALHTVLDDNLKYKPSIGDTIPVVAKIDWDRNPAKLIIWVTLVVIFGFIGVFCGVILKKAGTGSKNFTEKGPGRL